MSNKKTFTIGGIHPDKHKITADRPIEDAGLPETVYIPVKQHIGSPAKILVAKGDKVRGRHAVGRCRRHWSPPTFIPPFPAKF